MKLSTRAAALGLTAVMALGCAPLAMAGEYVVKKGDNLSKIAPAFNTTWRVLAEMNGLVNPNLIYPDQVLKVPDLEKPAEETVPAETIKPAEPVKEEKPAEETKETEEAKETEAILTGLEVNDITLTGNSISPKFESLVNEYTFNVQSDIYGVKVTPSAPEGSVVTVDGEEVESGSDVIVKLPDGYEDYDAEVKQEIEITVANGDVSNTYTVNVVRAEDNDAYALFEEKEYVDEETGVTMPYEIYVPSNYDASKKYPVVFALHGSGQRSQSLDMVLKRYQMATVWAKDSEAGINECIVLAPQCASKDDSDNWTTLMTYRSGEAENAFQMTDYSVAAYNLLEKTMEEYSVDKDRIYMTGLSAGGFATYAIAIAHPDTFAALVPVCGGADPEKVSALKGIPMWIFHAGDDPTLAPDEFLYPTLEALDAAKVEYKSTIYPEGSVFTPSAHFSWVPAYADEDMRNWLFEQSK